MSDPLNPPGTVVAKSGDPVPPQTNGKMYGGGVGAGVGAAIGGIFTSIAVDLVDMLNGAAAVGPDLTANIGIVCAFLGAIAGGALGAWATTNYLK